MVFFSRINCAGLRVLMNCLDLDIWKPLGKCQSSTVQAHSKIWGVLLEVKYRYTHVHMSILTILRSTAVAKLFWRGCKILRQDVRILPSHFMVTCYPYKEVHVTAQCDGKILITCHLFCTPGKIVRPRQ